MGGYNKKTGVFQLTQTKGMSWYRRRDARINPEESAIDFYARLLREAGLEVLSVHGNYLDVKAKPSQVWEALSGQPSDPSRAAHYGE